MWTPRKWFFLGLLFGIFAFALLRLLPSKRQMQLAAETAQAQPAENQNTETNPPLLTTTLEKRDWFYLDQDDKQQGPIDLDQLKAHKKEGVINEETLMWSEGMLDWKKLEKLSYLKTELE